MPDFADGGTLIFYFYPTQRPELNFHAFSPLDPGASGVYILRRKIAIDE